MNDQDIDLFLKNLWKAPLIKKYPNFESYPEIIQECLMLNDKIQRIGAS